jgi:signal transduction histidine kinase
MANLLHTATSRRVPGTEDIEEPRLLDPRLLGSLPAVFYETNENFRVTLISPNTEELLGILSSSLCGSNWSCNDRVAFPDRPLLQTQLAKLRVFPSISLIHRLIDDNGALIWVSHAVRARVDGARRYFHGCLTPMAGGLLDRPTVDVDTVSQYIHKIGNHFQLLNLMVDSIRRNGASTKNLDALQQTTETAIGLTRAFANLLQFSSATNIIKLPELVESAIESLTYLLDDQKDVHVEFPRADETIGIRGDVMLLEMAIAAVIANAIEASPTGGAVRVAVCTRAEAVSVAGPNMAVVRVVDCGLGLSENELLQANQPFYTTKPGHDGMGLSVASRYVELHGGFIHLSSVKGQGTEVAIALPLVSL